MRPGRVSDNTSSYSVWGSTVFDGDHDITSKNMPRFQSFLDDVNEQAGSFSRRFFWKTVLSLCPVVVVPGGITGDYEMMVVLDLGLRLDGGGSGARSRQHRRLVVAPEFKEDGYDPWSTRHSDKGLAHD
jgi:hypothetical protein